MNEEKIIVPIEISARSIKMLEEVLNETDNSELSIFIEEILKKTDETTEKIGDIANKIKCANPYSQKHFSKLQLQETTK